MVDYSTFATCGSPRHLRIGNRAEAPGKNACGSDVWTSQPPQVWQRFSLLLLFVLIPYCGSNSLAQDGPGKALQAYEEAYDAILAIKVADDVEYDASQFVPNWVVRAPGENKIRLALSPDEPAATQGIGIHRSEVIVQLRPKVDADEVADFLETVKSEFAATPNMTIPEIGVVVLDVNAQEALPDPEFGTFDLAAVDPTDVPGVESSLRIHQIAYEIGELQEVLVATPNTLIGTSALPSPSQGSGKNRHGINFKWVWTPGHPNDGAWGLKRTRFPAAWNFLDAIRRRNEEEIVAKGIHVGVLDTGFAKHVDLDYDHSGVTTESRSDHGMHVAGIIGAAWNGQDGIDGASPFVKLTCATMQNIDFTSADLESPPISLIITDVLSNLTKFIIEHPDVKVINISLGYNWVSNEGVEPNSDPAIQQLVRDHGIVSRAIVELAAERGIILVCAAGNDSRPGRLPAPIEAQWASPFNWAALNQGLMDTPAQNVIVVESIGPRDPAAVEDPISSFSNVNGCVSAPGEQILSLVATSNPFRPRFQRLRECDKCYAVFQGTSMAAPHVSGLIALMYAYNPSLTSEEVLRILGVFNANRPAATTPAPCIDAFDALVRCRPDSLKDLADLNNDGAVDMKDFDIFKDHLKQAETGTFTSDLNGDGAVTNAENLWPRSDLNGDGRVTRSDAVEVGGVQLTDLGVMQGVWEDPNVAAAQLPGRLN